ncbi:hypothetical protein B0187_09525 [Haemophilus paracuniculus]|uniref:Uncharacterized protein n=1 Tax=Haemophilus paracuniculus TaxID=734 RepID=A0A1T0AQ21_9PAST|nr:hypothetical protein B0187_09525 [Haemophilus paracuniculus]
MNKSCKGWDFGEFHVRWNDDLKRNFHKSYPLFEIVTFLFFASPKKSNQKKGDPEHFAFASLVSNFCGQFVNSPASWLKQYKLTLKLTKPLNAK